MSAMQLADPLVLTRFVSLTRQEWAERRADASLQLSEAELTALRGINETVSLGEVADVYLPLVRLLELYVEATRGLYVATGRFLGHPAARVPYVIGIAGSVAVGKSTTARIMQTLLARRPGQPVVELVTTDGFLYPNEVLVARSLLGRKGFPESYDVRRLMRFLIDVKAGKSGIEVPQYSHLRYNVLPESRKLAESPDIVIVEGLNMLQTGGGGSATPRLFVSDFFDFSIYVDALEVDIERWYVERFLTLCRTAFQDPSSYFHRYATLSSDEAVETALGIWRGINAVNLHENIQPTRERAHLILHKGPDHGVHEILLRKL